MAEKQLPKPKNAEWGDMTWRDETLINIYEIMAQGHYPTDNTYEGIMARTWGIEPMKPNVARNKILDIIKNSK